MGGVIGESFEDFKFPVISGTQFLFDLASHIKAMKGTFTPHSLITGYLLNKAATVKWFEYWPGNRKIPCRFNVQ